MAQIRPYLHSERWHRWRLTDEQSKSDAWQRPHQPHQLRNEQGSTPELLRGGLGETWDLLGSKYSYMLIGKNASTWMYEFLSGVSEVKYGNSILTSPYDYRVPDASRLPTYIVILRDPVDRWCSAITEFLVNSRKFREGIESIERPWDLDNREILDLLFGHAEFDWHTTPQVDFLDGLDTDQCIFFKLDQEFENTMRRFVEKELKIPTNDVIIRDIMYNTSERKSHQAIRKVIDFEIKTHPRYHNQIKAYYAMDIKLFNSVKFYE
jgi:hypothetical protein